MTNPLNMTTRHLEQMTTSELAKAHHAAVVLCSEEIVIYLADPYLSAKLSSLKADLTAERDERARLPAQSPVAL
jgi:hypothetical protein